MPPEVRYHMLRPQQIIARRQQCPVAYIPIGTIEWHGQHNAVGADTLQAEGLALLCAQRGGGLVFPPLYYGENRLQALMEANARDREQIAQAMALPAGNFAAERQPFSVAEQTLNYNRLLWHILAEAETLGFALGVLVAGHYPLIDHARAAVSLFNQWRRAAEHRMLAWAFVDYLLVRDRYPTSGDHAGIWETSHMLALHPQTVDLSLLPPKGQPLVGVSEARPPHDATAAFGQEILDAAVSVVLREVQHRLQHPDIYWAHGQSMSEGLWRNDG